MSDRQSFGTNRLPTINEALQYRSFDTELRRLRQAHWNLRFEWELLKRQIFAYKANFNPDQPRVPSGSSQGGQWTTTTIGEELTDFSAQSRIDYSNALTGISTIDNTTQSLAETLAVVVDTLPPGSGKLYGIAVHTAFANIVRLQNLPGIGFFDVETTFSLLPDFRYGSRGSIRTDVILRNEAGDIIAIYDVKTGDSTIRPNRAAELRANTQVGPNVPIIELNVRRGALFKSSTVSCRTGSFWQ
ncbi:MAG: hypothetical protein ACO1NY_15155 [Pseudorhodoplanes sp.]